jgi:hypothetical protein
MTGRLDEAEFVGESEAYVHDHRGAGADTLFLYAQPASEYDIGTPDVVVVLPGYAGPGTYALGRDAAHVWHTVGGDGVMAHYATRDSIPGTLVVTSDDDGVVAGTLDFVGVVEHPGYMAGGTFGPTQRFADGAFRALRKTR